MALIEITDAQNWTTCKAGGEPAATDDIELQTNGVLTLNKGNSGVYTCNTIRAVTSNHTTKSNGHIHPGVSTPYTINAKLYSGTVTMLANPTGSTITELLQATGWAFGCVVNEGTITHITKLYGAPDAGKGGAGCTNQAGGRIGTIDYTEGAYLAAGVSNAGIITLISETVGGAAYCGTEQTIVGGEGTIGTVTLARGGTGPAADGIDVDATITNGVVSAIGGSAAGAHGVVCTVPVTVGTSKGGSVVGACGALIRPGATGEASLTINAIDLSGVGAVAGCDFVNIPADSTFQTMADYGTVDESIHQFIPLASRYAGGGGMGLGL